MTLAMFSWEEQPNKLIDRSLLFKPQACLNKKIKMWIGKRTTSY